MSAMREELHQLVDQLPGAELRPALDLIRDRAAEHGEHGEHGRDLPFLAPFEAEPTLLSGPRRSETPNSAADMLLCGTEVRLAAGNVTFLRSSGDDGFSIAGIEDQDITRVAELVETYPDLSLGIVDTAVIASAERLRLTEIATLDQRHVAVVRPCMTLCCSVSRRLPDRRHGSWPA